MIDIASVGYQLLSTSENINSENASINQNNDIDYINSKSTIVPQKKELFQWHSRKKINAKL